MNSTTDRVPYMLLLRQPSGGVPAPDELKKIMQKFDTWMNGLHAKNQVLATHGLDIHGKVLRGPQGKTMTDGPFAETKEIIGGYVLIAAANEDEALAAARGCPGLNYGMSVEVRRAITRAD
jgi:hypothetical protein